MLIYPTSHIQLDKQSYLNKHTSEHQHCKSLLGLGRENYDENSLSDSKKV